MGILQDLVTKLQGFQESANSESAAAAGESSQEGSDLFLEIDHSSAVEANKEQVEKKFSFYTDFYLMEFLLLKGAICNGWTFRKE